MSGAGGCPHLDPAYRKFAGLPDDERIAWIRADRWIGFDQAGLALARLENLLTYPARDRMPCLLIYGDTGMGKTKIVRKFERAHPPKFCQVTGVDRRPVVVAQVPSEPLERDLYRELLSSMGAPAMAGGTLAREKDVCRALLRTVGAKMIILDEVNGMLAGTYRQQRIFLNAIRFLANDLRIPLVCAGTDLARQALLTDAQLAERFEAFHLKPWKNDAAFAGLLKSLGHILPLREPSDLTGPATRARVHALTSGVTARILRLIETAAEAAVHSGRERLDAESFGDDLVLPLVSMTQSNRRRSRQTLQPQVSA
ncbi:TniB family NTP-binding protein [Albidovulum sediminis]|uniref:TniB family NTP-binding protein n=1 Tax=Albidovulum sediminis TaxID=3066345 RepID=A0ABT2NRX7_9RHOB|nr:TniB family NTP-binding protein [Defluviimonas sediminis]MCT8331644.1 TniB family NTP-binding protein [Defluviimonas sediminis]